MAGNVTKCDSWQPAYAVGPFLKTLQGKLMMPSWSVWQNSEGSLVKQVMYLFWCSVIYLEHIVLHQHLGQHSVRHINWQEATALSFFKIIFKQVLIVVWNLEVDQISSSK